MLPIPRQFRRWIHTGVLRTCMEIWALLVTCGFFPHPNLCILKEGNCLLRPMQTRDKRLFAGRPSGFVVGVLLCLALLVLVSFVQVAHIHAVATDQDHCPICLVLHSAIPIAAAAAVLILFQIAVAPPVMETRGLSRHWHPQLFTRPPPAHC